MLAAMPLCAQSSRGASAASASSAEQSAPKSGVRFVICSPTGESLPSPLYCKEGKGFREIKISPRTPSRRVRPTGGVVEFWDKDPSEAAADEKGKKASSAASKKLPDPVFTVKVPEGAGGKMLCIVVPSKSFSKVQTYFLSEGGAAGNLYKVPSKGLHVINFSSFPLKMVTSEKGDFSDPVENAIGVFRRDEGISSKNSWSYTEGADKDGEGKLKRVAFVLMYKDKSNPEFKRFKASQFVVSGRQAQINLVVKDPGRDMPKLLPIQLMEDK